MNTAILLSESIGSRLKSDVPKQYIRINHKKIGSSLCRRKAKRTINLFMMESSDEVEQFIKKCNS